MRTAIALILLFASSLRAADLVLSGATVYPSPETPPIRDAVVVISEGRIAGVGLRASTRIPDKAEIIDCTGKYLVAGFWNCHVHILAPELLHAASTPAGALDAQLDEMFNRWGFTRVFDLASSLDNTLALRDRIERGELRGPRILTVGEPLWTEVPIYVLDFLAAQQLNMPAVKDPGTAVERVTQLAGRGVDGIKLFTGSMQRRGAVDNMPLAVVRAAAAEAHRRHLPVFTHPQNLAGLEAAIEGGVDILAHTTPQASVWTPELIARLKHARIALIPTLTLFDFEARQGGIPPAAIQPWLEALIGQLRTFSASGGEVLFGTDIGYIDHYDTTLEFSMMTQAGLSFPQILASLTTAPAARFGAAAETGRIGVGMEADLVVLDDDPAHDIAALAKVQRTLRHGRIIYERSGDSDAK